MTGNMKLFVRGIEKKSGQIQITKSEAKDSENVRPNYIVLLFSVKFSLSVMFDSCDPMDCSTPGLPVHHQLLKFTQTHVH